MIFGVHTLFYSRDPDATRAFVGDALGLTSVDAGHGWLIFALPPGEVAVHPVEGSAEPHVELYLMCTDVDGTCRELEAKGATRIAEISDQRWGRVTSLRIPGDVTIGLYEPKHPLAIPSPPKPG